MTAFNNQPSVKVKGNYTCAKGWEAISQQILSVAVSKKGSHRILVETYQGVHIEELMEELQKGLNAERLIYTKQLMKSEEDIQTMVYPDVTDDRIFGYLTRLNMEDYFDTQKVEEAQQAVANESNTVLVIGPGAAQFYTGEETLVYADMARWEIQQRMRRNEVDNLGVSNRTTEDWMLLYKQGFFVDWRVCDRYKKKLFDKIDLVIDSNLKGAPKMISGEAALVGYKQTVNQPFSVVPFFDPGPWGGQWMKEKCNLDPSKQNYAWCFNCVPEENSLLLEVDGELVELPSINVVFKHPVELMGDAVHGRFGDEFPIRFDFLDTMDGGNLSLQVHPLTEYIQEKFGLHYTQDESYYMMDTKKDAIVYLGFKEGVNPEECIEDLNKAQAGIEPFDADKHVEVFPVKKHDHVLIPAGTIHCSGKDSMVLEISATPYIFTFKLWDWGRVGLDGKPRPINLKHGENVMQWDRTTEWTKKNLVNAVEQVAQGDGWREERTGLHEREFIETRRHWFTKEVQHKTPFGVEVFCLVEGDQVVVESPSDAFEPFVVNYAEVAVIPANIREYTIRPCGPSEGKECATLKAYVRS
ncbi:class I mannose-6-phosphate isomerase [Flammeovirga pacifica]|uniref:Mannose-6-phosphate isomerase n=1 Tax=Flammeovirga pacifica TaxID=915059 RepID=A0A1S1YS42_FLAPC|nr:class I mannose-6-phosphate isomerase [Flammeovirga pacifica]OHX63846.1 mannose-6-phosphate isomerase [Flammeovirga pacifica]